MTTHKIIFATIITLFSCAMQTVVSAEKTENSFKEYSTSTEKIDKNHILTKLDYPEIPEDVPEVKRLLDLGNWFIEKFNTNQIHPKQIEEISRELQEMISKNNEHLKKQKTIHIIHPVFSYHTDQKSGEQALVGVSVLATFEETGKEIWPLLFMQLAPDKQNQVISIGSHSLLVNERYYAVFRTTSQEGKQFIAFLSGKEPQADPTPWIIWNKEGKVIENTKKPLLNFWDYNISGNEIRLRDRKLFSAE